jgi:hypothetical protein
MFATTMSYQNVTELAGLSKSAAAPPSSPSSWNPYDAIGPACAISMGVAAAAGYHFPCLRPYANAIAVGAAVTGIWYSLSPPPGN